MQVPSNFYLPADLNPGAAYFGQARNSSLTSLETVGYVLGTTKANNDLTCPEIRSIFDDLNSRISQGAATNRARVCRAGFSFHTSELRFSPFIDGTWEFWLAYITSPDLLATNFSFDFSGAIVVTVAGGEVTITDTYNKTIGFGSPIVTGFDVPAYEVALVYTDENAPMWYLPEKIQSAAILYDDFFNYYVSDCAVGPPAKPELPKFERLPKFANFTLPVNPFGVY